MSDKESGGYAFPGLNAEMTGIDSDGNERFDVEQSGGMTLRDYFAGKIINGLMAHHGCYIEEQPELPKKFRQQRECAMAFVEAAEYAYGQADAMIAERSKA